MGTALMTVTVNKLPGDMETAVVTALATVLVKVKVRRAKTTVTGALATEVVKATGGMNVTKWMSCWQRPLEVVMGPSKWATLIFAHGSSQIRANRAAKSAGRGGD